ncbi:MAG: EAL domain-containing protein, partial [Campylobacterota bacterium]|nr:EAL domain-containing protein [Campylobacterota bacterium]
VLWTALLLIPIILRNITAKAFLTNLSTTELKIVEYKYKSTTILINIILTSGIIYILPHNLPFHQAFLSMIVAGLSAGAVMSLSYYKNLIITYLLILILPFTYFIYIQGTQVHTLISVLMLVFLFMLIMFSKRYHKNILDLIISKLTLEKTLKEKEESEEKIRYQAFYDHLTGLANRLTFNDRLNQQLSKLARSKRYGAILFIDIDHFKTINDSLGHHIGDILLQTFASRTSQVIQKEDTVARLGGDEFVILLADLDNNEKSAIQKAHQIATKLHNLMEKPIVIEQNSLHISLSIGIDIIGSQEKDINNILKHADIAMYQAKEAGRNTTCFYKDAMGKEIQKKLTLSSELRTALKLNQFELYYQAIVEVKNDKIISAEALIRWNHPQKGLVFPDSFIPFAEESSLIIEIGDWVIDEACKQYKKCKGKLDDIAVNISTKQFMQTNFVEKIVETTKRNSVHPSALKLELTESVAVDNLDETIKKMNLLKSYGFKFSMDDFGTGYSSLSYLKNLPFDFIKIDRSFVKDMLENEDDASLIKTILTISKQFNFAVIAEGVETKEHIEFLKEFECNYYQGYVKSKPIPAKEFKKLTEIS